MSAFTASSNALNPAAACVAGLAAQEAGNMQDAVEHFERALALAPALIDVRLLLAFALGACGNSARARTILNECPEVETLPESDQRRLADAAVQIGASTLALKIVRRLSHGSPHDADLNATLGALLQRTGETDEASHVLNRGVLRWPKHVPTLLNSANLLAASGAYTEALRNYDRALQIAPPHHTARWYRGMLRLTMGDLAGGWTDCEARRSLPVHIQKAPTTLPAWNGRNAAGRTLLLWGEQGLGDQIQGVRFASHLAELGARVVVRCAPALQQLFENVRGVSQVVAEGSALPKCDAHVPMLSVPFLCKMFEDDDYGSAPYLPVPSSPARRDVVHNFPQTSVGSSYLTGVVWAGSAGHINDANRSLSPQQLGSLLDGVSTQWVSLQVGARCTDLSVLSQTTRADVVDVSAFLTDFVDTAQILSALDRVVTVDTAVAHLAGALGVPTLLLIPFVPDWRWQLAREDSPWYRSIRVLRQPGVRDWESVISRAHRELAAGGHARAA